MQHGAELHMLACRPRHCLGAIANFVLCGRQKIKAVNNGVIEMFKTNFYSVVITEASHRGTIHHKEERVNLQDGLGQ